MIDPTPAYPDRLPGSVEVSVPRALVLREVSHQVWILPEKRCGYIFDKALLGVPVGAVDDRRKPAASTPGWVSMFSVRYKK